MCFFESHPVYDQTQGTGAVFSWLYGYLYHKPPFFFFYLHFLYETQWFFERFQKIGIKVNFILIFKEKKKRARINGSFATFTLNIFQKTKWNKLQHFFLGPKFRHLATDYSFEKFSFAF
jgi:hypothetical protein